MKVCVVFCTIRATKSFENYAHNFHKHGHAPNIVVVDEDGSTRKHIAKALKGLDVVFYGKKERDDWVKFFGLPPQIVPPKTTDVIGFSLLAVKDLKYDMIVFLDDDTYVYSNQDFLGTHYDNLFKNQMRVRHGVNGWVNPHPLFTRGYPYSLRLSHEIYCSNDGHPRPVLNMGMWRNVPDLNAMDYLYNGFLDGQLGYTGLLDTESYAIKHSYFPLSRMNIAFKPKITPAFYQWTGNVHGVGRYGDVFSGLFLMKIARHLGDCVSYGQPFCIHNKEPRDVFRDIQSECESIKLNEIMWKVLDTIELEGKDYSSCYLSLADGLLAHKNDFHIPKYMEFLVERMRDWVEAFDT